jgi:glucose/mannose-6-phosphate isomerase
MLERETINLDDLEVYPQFDLEGMLVHLHEFPHLCRQAWQMALEFKLPKDYSRVRKIVVLGMGGSAIGGDLVNTLGLDGAKAPLLVCRDYNLPRYVDEETMVIASSYSGMTEETLSAFKQAFDTGAKKLAITTGGRLKSLCETTGVPVFTFAYRSQPRAALPFSFLAILGILHNLGLLHVQSGEMTEALSSLESLSAGINEKASSAQNPAKSLAQKLQGRLPVIYGAGITAGVAQRWKTQINENSKTMAFYEIFPELDHNAIVGYSLPAEVTNRTMVILLDSDLLHERVRMRFAITRMLLEQAGIYYQVLKGEGEGALSQILTLALYGDYVSYYLAILNQVDPTPVKPISFLKDSLANPQTLQL